MDNQSTDGGTRPGPDDSEIRITCVSFAIQTMPASTANATNIDEILARAEKIRAFIQG